MKKIILFILLNLYSFVTIAQNLNVELEPKIPTAGERFDLIFQVKLEGNQGPKITFKYGELQLLGKRSGGVSLNTTIINGKVVTTKEMTYVYSFVAKRPGIFAINEILVEVDGKSLNYAPFEIEVLKERKEASGYFLLAIPSKTDIFLGEGIDISYYIYHHPQLRVTGEAVDEFPKFEKFIKRFQNIQPTVEAVSYQGAVYHRRLLYSARLYPEKTGTLKIDPLRITFQYYNSEKTFNPFGGFGSFGFSSRSTEQKSIASKEIAVNVKPIPNPPSDFTGLIGPHDFKLEMGRQKVLVNEPIELKFIVEGPGALENFAGPSLYKNPLLEEFDSKSQITELGINRARKTFDYTYLPKGPFQKENEEITFSFFDPGTEKFISKRLTLPGITVGGASIKSFSSGNNIYPTKSEVASSNFSDTGILAPLFMEKKVLTGWGWINYLLGILVLLVIMELGYKYFIKTNESRIYLNLCYRLKTKGPDYSTIHRLLNPLNKGSIEISLMEVINNSPLSNECKDYLKNLVVLSEKKSYGNQGVQEKFIYKESFFKELLEFLQKR